MKKETPKTKVKKNVKVKVTFSTGHQDYQQC